MTQKVLLITFYAITYKFRNFVTFFRVCDVYKGEYYINRKHKILLRTKQTYKDIIVIRNYKKYSSRETKF